MDWHRERVAAEAIQRELTASIYRSAHLRARHLIHLLCVAEPSTYAQLVELLLRAPRVDGLVTLLNRIAVYLDSSETLTGEEMDVREGSAKILSLSPPWVQVDLWQDGRHFDVAVLIKRLVLRDVVLYRRMPGSRGDVGALPFMRHEPVYNDIVKRFLLKPELLMIFFWAGEGANRFHRVNFRHEDGKIFYETRHGVAQRDVEEAAGFELSESPF